MFHSFTASCMQATPPAPPKKPYGSASCFSVDMTLHSIYWYHKVFFAYKEVMHSSNHFLNEFTCVVFYCFFVLFFSVGADVNLKISV